jgi:hypothetical protein
MTEINEVPEGFYDAETVAKEWGTGFSEGALQAIQSAQENAARERAVQVAVSAYESGLYAPNEIAAELGRQFGSEASEQFVGYWRNDEAGYAEPVTAEEYVAQQQNLSETLRELSARMQVNQQAQEAQARFEATTNAIGSVVERYPDAAQHKGVLEETVKLLTPDTDPETVGSFVETGVKVGREQQRVIEEAERVAAAQHMSILDKQQGWTDGLSAREQRPPSKAEWERYTEARVADRANELIAKSELNLRNIAPETDEERYMEASKPILDKLSRAQDFEDEVGDAAMSARENRGKNYGMEIGEDRPDFKAASRAAEEAKPAPVEDTAAAKAAENRELSQAGAWWVDG